MQYLLRAPLNSTLDLGGTWEGPTDFAGLPAN